ncbi:MAG: HTTM domain-containing protein [Bacteroidota bacterium]
MPQSTKPPNHLTTRLTAPTPIGTLVFLRIAVGLLGAGDLLGNGIYWNWYKGSYANYTFSYYGFTWVQPLPEPLLSLFFVVGFLLGLGVAFGWRFRLTAPLFAVCFSYLFLLEKAHYLNHAYLFVWLTWMLAFSPAWRALSLDVRRNPKVGVTHVPAWSVYLFPAMMGVVYFWGGIAKINHDWLLEAMPMHMWLQRRGNMPVLGWLWQQETTAYVMSWGGMLLDLLAPFMLLHKRLRWVALALLMFFHATNHLIFNIGIFPYLSMVLTSMFFDPDWPRRAGIWVLRQAQQGPRTQVQSVLGRQGEVSESSVAPPRVWTAPVTVNRLLVPALILFFGFHCYLPLRHHLFASDVNWSEEGHRYSWRMMLRSKQGNGNFWLVNRKTGEETFVQPRDSLDERQFRKMVTHPDMILQYAHHLRDAAAARGEDVAVYGRFRARLNGRDYQTFIDPEVDLSQVEWQWWGAKAWVLPE